MNTNNPEDIRARQGVTVAQMADEWLEVSRGRLKRSTLSAYGTTVRAHILPDLGSRRISRLKPREIEGFLASKSELSPRTVYNISTVLRGVFFYAKNRGYIKNIPIWTCPRARVRTEAGVMLPEERRALEVYLASEPDGEKAGLLLCLYTGMRLGEICALRWGDISQARHTVSIRRTVQRVYSTSGRTELLLDTPKSASSVRTIPIPAFLWDILEPFRAGDECFVLTGRPGLLEPRTMQNHFKAILKKCGLRDINFHAIRHTFATDCVEAGFDIKTISSILGHSSVAVTLNTYVHPSFDSMRRMMDGLESRFSQVNTFAKDMEGGPIHVRAQK